MTGNPPISPDKVFPMPATSAMTRAVFQTSRFESDEKSGKVNIFENSLRR